MRRVTVPVVAAAALSLLIVAAVVVAGGGPECRARGVAMARAEGPAGLKRTLDAYADVLARGPRPNDARWREAADAVDAVAGQRDAWASRLYWHTDLEAAKIAAAREDKPILSLRLLGKLDEDLSCANSRFFRTTLYPDPRVNSVLRDKFILHWSSERPVPVVTIDFGDGRTMKRTITGNSAHYVLDADGRPLDVLPGLYSAREFVAKLTNVVALAAEKPTDSRLREWHAAAAAQLDSIRAMPSYEALAPQVMTVIGAKGGVDVAAAAAAAPARPDARAAGRLAMSKAAVEMPVVNAIAALQMTIAQDTIQNEYAFHRQIHQWFAAGDPAVATFQTLNERVYAELFLTPRSDPWLGLAPAHAFSALEAGGLAQK
jgi:hypothetical protein